MKKMLVAICLSFMLMFVFAAGDAMATVDPEGCYQHSVTGKIKYFKSHPGSLSQWVYIGECSPEDIIDENTNIYNNIGFGDKREFLSQPMITFSALGEYKEGVDMGANFQTVEMLTMFKKVFSYDAAFKNYGKQYGKGKCETIGHSYNGRHENEPSKEIGVYTLDDLIDPLTVKSIGFLTIKSIDKNINSFMVLQKAVLSAALMQGDAIVITKQGAETVTKSSGWGLGFNTSGGVIAENGARGKSAVGSGGTGYSNGTAKLLTMPWMTVQVLVFK